MVEWAAKPVSRSFKLEIKRAVHTLSSFLGTGYAALPDDAWVRTLLSRAHGIGLLSVYKLGFLGAVTGGGGLLLGRDVATGAWSAPCAVGAAGVSIGAQVGGELNEILLVLNTREALASLTGSTQVKLGLNLSVAMGPVGRQIEGTGVAGGKGSAACYAYAVSRGAFAGVALDGTVRRSSRPRSRSRRSSRSSRSSIRRSSGSSSSSSSRCVLSMARCAAHTLPLLTPPAAATLLAPPTPPTPTRSTYPT